MRYVSVLWPGLRQIWVSGAWSGLALAWGFAACLNAALWLTWGWTEIVDRATLMGLWAAVVLFWIGGIVHGVRLIQKTGATLAPVESSDLFSLAQGEYLKGSWFEAEVAIQRLLERNPRDVDARLMLASLHRQVGHAEDARAELRRLATYEGAGKWQLEIAREWEMVRQIPVAGAAGGPSQVSGRIQGSAQDMHPESELPSDLPIAA